jgi:uncharacterized protein (DUF433 family)
MSTTCFVSAFDMSHLRAAEYRDDVDPRELAEYTPADASRFLGISQATINRWLYGRKNKYSDFRPLISPADPEAKLLSFFNLVELHVLAATRYEHKVKFEAIRIAIDTVQAKYPSEHPLISHDFVTNGCDIFLQTVNENENLSTVGQTNLKQVMDMFLVHIDRDKHKLAERIYPVIKNQPHDKVISIRHGIASGQPVIGRRAVPVFIVYGRAQAGELPKSIARDFGISEAHVQRAIDYVEKTPIKKGTKAA